MTPAKLLFAALFLVLFDAVIDFCARDAQRLDTLNHPIEAKGARQVGTALILVEVVLLWILLK